MGAQAVGLDCGGFRFSQPPGVTMAAGLGVVAEKLVRYGNLPYGCKGLDFLLTARNFLAVKCRGTIYCALNVVWKIRCTGEAFANNFRYGVNFSKCIAPTLDFLNPRII